MPGDLSRGVIGADVGRRRALIGGQQIGACGAWRSEGRAANGRRVAALRSPASRVEQRRPFVPRS